MSHPSIAGSGAISPSTRGDRTWSRPPRGAREALSHRAAGAVAARSGTRPRRRARDRAGTPPRASRAWPGVRRRSASTLATTSQPGRQALHAPRERLQRRAIREPVAPAPRRGRRRRRTPSRAGRRTRAATRREPSVEPSSTSSSSSGRRALGRQRRSSSPSRRLLVEERHDDREPQPAAHATTRPSRAPAGAPSRTGRPAARSRGRPDLVEAREGDARGRERGQRRLAPRLRASARCASRRRGAGAASASASAPHEQHGGGQADLPGEPQVAVLRVAARRDRRGSCRAAR